MHIFINIKKILIILFTICVVTINSTPIFSYDASDQYAYIDSLFVDNKKVDFSTSKIENKLRFTEDIFANSVIMGDSTSVLMHSFIIDNYHYDVGTRNYELPGQTIIENFNSYEKCLFNDEHPIVWCLMGYNDHFRQTSLRSFKNFLDVICAEAYINGKLIVLHSYMDTDAHNVYKILFPAYQNFFLINASEYNYIIKKMAYYYGNVVFVDCDDLNSSEYACDDKIHFNDKFYKELTKRALAAVSRKLNLK